MPNCYLPSNRLKKKQDFTSVFEGKNVVKTKSFIFFYSKSTDSHEPKLGIVVSKKVMPRAVDRNKLKRLHREFFRTHKAALTSWYVIALARNSLRDQPLVCVKQELNRSWGKLLRCLAN